MGHGTFALSEIKDLTKVECKIEKEWGCVPIYWTWKKKETMIKINIGQSFLNVTGVKSRALNPNHEQAKIFFTFLRKERPKLFDNNVDVKAMLGMTRRRRLPALLKRLSEI